MYNTEIIKLACQSYSKSTYANVVGSGYGFKFKNGKRTNQKCLIFFVSDKKQIEELLPEDIIPSKIEFLSLELETDVEKSNFGFLEEQQFIRPYTTPNCPERPCDAAFYSWMVYPPINRNQNIPLKGGQGQNTGGVPKYVDPIQTDCTMGGIVVDNETNSLLGVTNNHCVMLDIQRSLGFDFRKQVSRSLMEIYNRKIYDSGLPSKNLLGTVYRFSPINSRSIAGGIAYSGSPLDCCLYRLDPNVIDFNESYKYLGFTGWTQPMRFATTEELNNLVELNPNIFSTGRTSGPKGEGQVKIKIHAIHVFGGSSGGMIGQDTTLGIEFQDCFSYFAEGSDNTYCGPGSYPGDSGSFMLAEINNERVIIGQLFAGDQSFGIAQRIDVIANVLNVRAWMGEILPFIDDNSLEIKTQKISDSYYGQNYIVENEKTFWVGGNRRILQTPTPTSTQNNTPNPTPTPTSTPQPSCTNFLACKNYTIYNYFETELVFCYYPCYSNFIKCEKLSKGNYPKLIPNSTIVCSKTLPEITTINNFWKNEFDYKFPSLSFIIENETCGGNCGSPPPNPTPSPTNEWHNLAGTLEISTLPCECDSILGYYDHCYNLVYVTLQAGTNSRINAMSPFFNSPYPLDTSSGTCIYNAGFFPGSFVTPGIGCTPTHTPIIATPTNTVSPSITPSITPSNSQTSTPPPSGTKFATPTPSVTNTQTPSITPSNSQTRTPPPSATPTPTPTGVETGIFSVFIKFNT
jgi:hypothetical protein